MQTGTKKKKVALAVRMQILEAENQVLRHKLKNSDQKNAKLTELLKEANPQFVELESRPTIPLPLELSYEVSKFLDVRRKNCLAAFKTWPSVHRQMLDRKPKRQKTKFSATAVTVMEQLLARTRYPDRYDAEVMAIRFGITTKQVQNWYQNRRSALRAMGRRRAQNAP